MICVTIAQQSRRFARVDMLNASEQCGLVEVRLDRFSKAPEISELLTDRPVPVMISCRRKQDGGEWEGSEDERLSVLRQCIAAKADYVEIELDVAEKIRRFGPTKRVISYTNLHETPADIYQAYTKAQSCDPDLIKLHTLTRTADEAWPLFKIVAMQRTPTVVAGVGKSGVMLSLVASKIGVPWIYAALEKGMEDYPGQPTVRELREIYHCDQIKPATPLIGVTGCDQQYITIAVLNHALAELGVPTRCLPIGTGSGPILRKLMDVARLRALVIDPENQDGVMELASGFGQSAQQIRAADLLVLADGKEWHARNRVGHSAVSVLQATLRTKDPNASLAARLVLIVGVNALARAMAYSLKDKGAALIIASHERDKAQALAQALECRCVQFEALYTTMHDILIVCDQEKQHFANRPESGEPGIHPGYLRAGMTVMDLTAPFERSGLLDAAAQRGGNVVEPRNFFCEQVITQLRLICGKEVPRQTVEDKLASLLAERA
jgi:3-dehydroquinate dehydratase/shikimate dehydrogenase